MINLFNCEINKMNLTINKILFLSILILTVQNVFAQNYVPPVMDGYTRYNRDYYDKMISESKPTQESPWGFQEIYVADSVVHTVHSISEYKSVYSNNTFNGVWFDGKTHIVYFASGTYNIPYNAGDWYVMMVPSRTIILGAGMGKTIFKAVHEMSETGISLFALANADDVVIRDVSFYNETKDNKWAFLRGTDWSSATRENFLFENIEYDDSFGAFGVSSADGCKYNFITYRGLRKRIGNTTDRINANYTTPVPATYQFPSMNDNNIKLAAQVGVRHGNSVVFHNCVLGDNISATIDIYNNYIEMVGISFIDPLHDHSVKCPNGNHLYIHDSEFELTYTDKIMSSSYWNPTFFTHEGGCYANYHFKDLSFKRAGQIINDGTQMVESEPFTVYDNRDNNVSGDMVWENIEFDGYDNEIVGYPDVQTDEGFQAINYTGFTAREAQLKSRDMANFSIIIEQRTGTSKEDLTGVYSWGQSTDGNIDFPRDNKCFKGTKSEMENKPYVEMYNATVKNIYNARLSPSTSINLHNSVKYKIYPNPTSGEISIEGEGIREIEVVDLSGKSYKSNISNNGNSHDLSNLPKGIYLVKITSENSVRTEKIVLN